MPERRLLNIILVAGIIDAVLFIALIYVAFINRNDSLVPVLGMTHGIGFIVLVVLTVRGTMQGYWSWKYPFWTVVTLGPPGSIVGDIIIRRRLPDGSTTPPSESTA